MILLVNINQAYFYNESRKSYRLDKSDFLFASVRNVLFYLSEYKLLRCGDFDKHVNFNILNSFVNV